MAWLTRVGWLVGGRDTRVNLVMIGLTNSGKSTLMRQLKPKDVTLELLSPLIPLAPSAESFHFKSIAFSAFDLDIQSVIGNPWEDLYKHGHGIIFVVDSANRMNFSAVRAELQAVIRHPLLADRPIPILIMANKMDQALSVSEYQLSDLLGLNGITDRPCRVFSTDALTGEGLGEALDWLALQLKHVCKVTN